MMETTIIPRTVTWDAIDINANKDFALFDIINANIINADIINAELSSAKLLNALNANAQQIENLGIPTTTGDALSMGNPIPVLVGNAPFSFNDIQRSTTSNSFVRIKETRIWRRGAYRISFEMRMSGRTGRAFGRIYRNGVPLGTERETSGTTWRIYTEDINGWEIGDYVQLWAYTTSGTFSNQVKNLRLYIHESNLTETIL